MKERLPHRAIAQPVDRPGKLRPVLDLHIGDARDRLDAHEVAGASPAIADRHRAIKIDPARDRHLESFGQHRRAHRVGVEEEANDDAVEGRPTEEVVVESLELEVGAGLPAGDLVGSEPNPFVAELRAVDEVRSVVQVDRLQHVPRQRHQPLGLECPGVGTRIVDDVRERIRRVDADHLVQHRGCAARMLGVLVELIRERHVAASEWRSVVPADVRAQPPGHIHRAVGLHHPGTPFGGR